MTATRITVMGQLRGGQKIAFDRQRVTGLVAAILSLVLLAGSVGALIGSPGGTKLINAGFALVIWLARWLLIAGGFLLYPLIVAFFSLVQWVLSRLSLHPVKLTMNQQMDEILKQLQDLSARQRAFPFNIHILQPLILAELILLAAAAAILLIRDRIARDKAASLGETEALLSPDELLRQMLLSARKNAQSLLNGLAQRLGLGRIARQLAAQRIRAIYTELLDLATQLKYPRCPHQTPLEYLPELQKAFPGSQTELDLITQAYQRIRYGEFPESQAEVNAIESAWRQVQSEGQKILIELRT
jgi:hypothetical protein